MPLPLMPAIQTGAGLLQSIIGGAKARKTQRELERMQSPQYKQSQGILDYYNEALSRYGVSPQESALYKSQMQNIGRSQAAAISGLQDRRSAIAGLGGVLRGASDAALNAEVAAEQQRNQRFGQLGQAAQMKMGEEQKAYQYNEMMPFERQWNLKAQKAGAANMLANAGLSNIFGGLQNAADMDMLNKIYGVGKKTKKVGGFYNTKYGKLYK